MRRRRKGLSQIWFNERVREALNAAEQGRDAEAIELLDRLADDCHEATREDLAEWHEIQALGLLGVELESQHAHAEAAAVYRRIADLRRDALLESGHGLASALAAAAVASLRAGKRTAARKLAEEARALHDTYPLPRHDFELLQREVLHGGARRRTTNLPRAASNRVPMSRARRSKRTSKS